MENFDRKGRAKRNDLQIKKSKEIKLGRPREKEELG